MAASAAAEEYAANGFIFTGGGALAGRGDGAHGRARPHPQRRPPHPGMLFETDGRRRAPSSTRTCTATSTIG